MLGRLQRGLEKLYRIETELDVEDFLIDSRARDAMGVARAPREQLLILEQDGELNLGLFIDEEALGKMADGDARAAVGANLHDFLLTVEGVSHFVYLAWRARNRRPVSAFELELQAEVDKYVTCLLTLWQPGAAAPASLPQRLFDDVRFAADLDDEERDRYRVANENARSFAASLEARYVEHGQVGDMLEELRRFYRLGAQEKLAHIAWAA